MCSVKKEKYRRSRGKDRLIDGKKQRKNLIKKN
jgi:hypothetical protein